jgi:hypothetical protein
MRNLRRSCVFIALVALTWPTSARAGSISIDTFFQGYGAHMAVAGQDASFEIGSVVMSHGEGLGAPLDEPATFEAYCVDFNTAVFGPTLPDPPGTYDATRADMSGWVDGSGLPAQGNGQRAAWLYNEFATTFDADATSDLGKRQRAALQMAIWNGLYDADFTVTANSDTNNTVYFIEDNRNLTVLANSYLAALELAGAAVGASNAAWLQLASIDTNPDGTRTDAQDFIGPTAVPEPSAALLLGMGVLSLAAFRSRKALLRRA